MSLSYDEILSLARRFSREQFRRELGGVGVLLKDKKVETDDEDGWSFNTSTSAMNVSIDGDEVGFILRNDDRYYPIKKAPGATAFANTILVGRAVSNDICITDSCVSKLHARILLQADGLTLADNDSHNGTMLGPERLEPHTKTPLAHGQWIFLGERGLQFLQLDELYDALTKQ